MVLGSYWHFFMKAAFVAMTEILFNLWLNEVIPIDFML